MALAGCWRVRRKEVSVRACRRKAVLAAISLSLTTVLLYSLSPLN